MLRTQNMYTTSNPQVSTIPWLGQSGTARQNRERRLISKLLVLGNVFATGLRCQRLFCYVVFFVLLCFGDSTRAHGHSSLTT